MKKISAVLAAVFITLSVFAQPPQKMSYQAVIRNSNSALIVNTPVAMRISILQSSYAVYVETQTQTTNANGLVTLEIGIGVTTDNFAAIDWANGPYFIKTETDPTGGTNYSIVGTSELLSVPYALFAANGTAGSQGPIGLTGADGAPGIQGPIGLTGDPGVAFDDTQVLTTKTWTSTKINDELILKANVTSLAAIATSGIFNDIINKPTTLAGYGITDALTATQAAGGITFANIANWNAAYRWGDHASAGYLKSFTETDPLWTAASSNYYTKTDLQVSGSAQLHFGNITNTPTTLSGYGITDAALSTHNHSLDGLTNIAITSKASGDILKWDGNAWVNNTLVQAGIQPAGLYLTGNQTISFLPDSGGDVTGSSDGETSLIPALTIGAGKVTLDKIVGLASGQMIVGTDGTAAGNASVLMNGDATMTSAGTVSIADNAITSVKMADNAIGNAEIADNSISASKLQGAASNALSNGISGEVLQSDGAGKFGWVNISNILSLTAGSFYVGDTNDQAIATAKNTIPMSGFATPAADVQMGDGTANYKIVNLADPTDNQDAATKKFVVDSKLIPVLGNMYQGTATDLADFNGLSWSSIAAGTNLGTSISNTICDLSKTAYTWIAFPKAWGSQNFFYRYGTPAAVYAVFDGFEKRLIPAVATGTIDYQVWIFKTIPNIDVSLIANN